MTIKILGIPYKVIKVKHIDNSNRTWGEIDYEKQAIKICSDLKKDRIAETLLHEILHGIIAGLGIELENEESLVQSISATMYQTLRDNKKLTKILVS